MGTVAALRANSDPWKTRGETQEESLQALTQLRPFTHVARVQNQVVGYITVERDGPVPGAAYMRNIVVRPDLRKHGLGTVLLNHAIQTARDMYRKTIALRVDPGQRPGGELLPQGGLHHRGDGGVQEVRQAAPVDVARAVAARAPAGGPWRSTPALPPEAALSGAATESPFS